MASHRRPKQSSRARITVLTAAAATAVAISSQSGAWADPAPTVDQVKAQIDALNNQQEAAAEQYDGAKERGDQLRQQASQLQDEVARTQDQVTQLQGGLAAVAGQQYRDGGIDPSVQLMLNSHPGTYLDQASSMQVATSTEADALKSLQGEERNLDQIKKEAADTLAQLDSATAQLNQAKSDVQAKLAAAQKLLNSLSASQRAQLAAQQAAASRGSARAQLSTLNLPPASGYAGQAVQAALTRLGDSYVWGATGQTTFDCSGLMQWAYEQAGVSLPRTSQEQATVGTGVPSLADAQPGDLVIFGGDRHHVGMYIGGGNMVHAPHTGDVVRIASVSTMGESYIIRRV
ncbi:C40 family peptidase [Kitasatospora sp. GAS204B]|uniref:C40 family peptidase n=1 Tax=unclassified Kitasatospora TaxID=2633591 RepID=UPI002476A182|nr:C40 family peptidase [Kitasatospora sp. GAS204B]MDH6115872.1 cell wall-associated NlpC family hydrolase/FtsZ-binding cell division protein ZapB [Kitasatospora sp. GAS204B]